MEKYILLLIVICTGTFGQILLKMEANQLASLLPKINSIESFFSTALMLLKNFRVLLILFLYGLGFFLWVLILTKFELSYVLPVLAATTYGLVLTFSWLFLKEDITALRIFGTLTIVFGIILVIKS